MRNVMLEKAYYEKKNNVKSVLMQEASKFTGGKKDANKNIIIVDDIRIGVSFSPGERAEIRQFYDGTDLFLTYSLKNGHWYLFPRKDLNMQTKVNRISTDGIKAYTATSQFNDKYKTWRL